MLDGAVILRAGINPIAQGAADEPLKCIGDRTLDIGFNLGDRSNSRFAVCVWDVIRPLISDNDVQRTYFVVLDTREASFMQHRVTGKQIPLAKRSRLWAIGSSTRQIKAVRDGADASEDH